MTTTVAAAPQPPRSSTESQDGGVSPQAPIETKRASVTFFTPEVASYFVGMSVSQDALTIW
jgi:hypothetical protein